MRHGWAVASIHFIVLLAWASAGLATAPRMPYQTPPGGLVFDHFQVVSWDKAKGGILKCVLRSEAGTLSDLEITFESSSDLKVGPASARVSSLNVSEEKEFHLNVRRVSAGKKGIVGPWVGIRVKYLPDYPALQKWVQTDPRKFSSSDAYLGKILDILKTRESQRQKTIFAESINLESEGPDARQ